MTWNHQRWIRLDGVAVQIAARQIWAPAKTSPIDSLAMITTAGTIRAASGLTCQTEPSRLGRPRQSKEANTFDSRQRGTASRSPRADADVQRARSCMLRARIFSPDRRVGSNPRNAHERSREQPPARKNEWQSTRFHSIRAITVMDSD